MAKHGELIQPCHRAADRQGSECKSYKSYASLQLRTLSVNVPTRAVTVYNYKTQFLNFQTFPLQIKKTRFNTGCQARAWGPTSVGVPVMSQHKMEWAIVSHKTYNISWPKTPLGKVAESPDPSHRANKSTWNLAYTLSFNKANCCWL